MNPRLLLVIVLCALVLFLAACSPPPPATDSPFQHEEAEYVLAFVIDVSPSLDDFALGKDGRAFRFFIRNKDAFFRDRAGSSDRILLAQISGKEKALLWDGTPRHFRREFPNASALKRYYEDHAHFGGSRVFDSLTDTVKYLVGYHETRKVKSTLIVLSDMDDNFPNADHSKARLLAALKDYANKGGMVGFYWVDHRFAPEWKRHLSDAGFRHFRVESDIVAEPPLLEFD